MKILPVLGGAVIIGLLLQIFLGFLVPGESTNSAIHIVLGFAGLIVAIAFVAIALRSKTATMASKITMIIFLALVIAQTWLGFSVMTGNGNLETSHMYAAFAILVVALAAAGITARRPAPKPSS